MAFNKKDITLQWGLLASYESQYVEALKRQALANEDVRKAGQAVRATKEILWAAGEDV